MANALCSLAGGAPSTRSGTEAPGVRPLVCRKVIERRATRRANPHNSSVTVALGIHDERLVIRNSVSPRPLTIAAVAGWHKILKSVVLLLSIQVVDRQRSRLGAMALCPIHQCAAPMTSVRAGADALIKHPPMGQDAARRVGKRVPRCCHLLVGVALWVGRFYASSRRTILGAIPHPSTFMPRQRHGEFLLASLANMQYTSALSHWHSPFIAGDCITDLEG